MNHAAHRPALRRAVAFVNNFIATHPLKPGQRLPATWRLAEQAGVSYVTMYKAVRQARATASASVDGISPPALAPRLTKAADGPPAPKSSGASPRPWRLIATKITEDIRNGAFRPGEPLPPKKEMERRYRVSFKTMSKSLSHLTAEGSIERLANGSLAVPGYAARKWRSKIVCLVFSSDGATMAFGQNDEAVFRALESYCEQAHIDLDIQLIVFDEASKDHLYKSKMSGTIRDATRIGMIDDQSTLGYVVFIPWKPWRSLHAAIVGLAALRKPLVIMDETPWLALPQKTRESSWVRLFSVAKSTKAAETVADHLLKLGHRTVVYLSIDSEMIWSQRRLEGLVASFSRSAYYGRVIPLVTQAEMDAYQNAKYQCDFSPFDRSYASWRKTAPPAYRLELDPMVERLHIDGCQNAEGRLKLQPLLEQALALQDVTAWVAGNDATASRAMAFLKERGIPVPGRLSLVSFDDTSAALRNNFSSYNFNAYAYASFIVGTILGRKPYVDADVNVAGFIVDRGSTGPLRR